MPDNFSHQRDIPGPWDERKCDYCGNIIVGYGDGSAAENKQHKPTCKWLLRYGPLK